MISGESELSRHDTDASARKLRGERGEMIHERERDVEFGGGPGCEGSASAEVVLSGSIRGVRSNWKILYFVSLSASPLSLG